MSESNLFNMARSSVPMYYLTSCRMTSASAKTRFRPVVPITCKHKAESDSRHSLGRESTTPSGSNISGDRPHHGTDVS